MVVVMRVVVLLAALLVCLIGAESAQATSCIAPPALERLQAADAAVVAKLVEAKQLAGPVPRNQPVIIGAPTGPVVLHGFQVVRVYKASSDGPRVGQVFYRWGRIHGDQLPPLGPRSAWLLERHGNNWDGRLPGLCGYGVSIEELHAAAVINRYGSAGGAESFHCRGNACWSIKRQRREVILRLATDARDGDFTPLRLRDFEDSYDLCVRSPDGARRCHRFRLRPDAQGVLSSRVRWSRYFPSAGHGTYRVSWLPPDFRESGYDPRMYRKFLPRLSFER
jgi:hypothetical protein